MPTIAQLQAHVDKIVLIDMDNGMQLTTRIKNVEVEHNQLITEAIIMFQLAHMPPQGPGQQPQPSIQAQHLGGPFRNQTSPPPPIDIHRIMFVHTPIDEIEKAYMQATSGIEIAGAGAIQGIRG